VPSSEARLSRSSKGSALMALVSKQELMRHFGMKVHTFDKYLAAGMPYVDRADRSIGKSWLFDTEEVTAWLEENQDNEQLPGSKEYEAARTRKMNADADLAEHRLALKRGEVVP